MAVTFAIWVPIAAVLIAGAIDLASVNATHQAIQDAADAAALDAARQLGVANGAGLSARTSANVAAQLSGQSNFTYSVTTTTGASPPSVTVTINANRTSFFGNLLPPGGWNMTSSSTAVQMSTVPLCVLQTGTVATTEINLAGTTRITAPGCLVHGNSGVQVSGSSQLNAGLVQSSALASGPITPTPQSGAPVITDPFASMNLSPAIPACLPVPQVLAYTTQTLLPGVHCGNLTVSTGATLNLLPGEHYFKTGSLTLQQNAVLTGDDVVLFFDDDADFQFTQTSDIRLRGRRTGQFAGFVLATTRQNNHTFNISSTSAHELLGTVYVPNATLAISGTQNIADQSAWTVIVARNIRTQGSATLVVNSNYSGSTVPVPMGVGPNGSAVRLAH